MMAWKHATAKTKCYVLQGYCFGKAGAELTARMRSLTFRSMLKQVRLQSLTLIVILAIKFIREQAYANEQNGRDLETHVQTNKQKASKQQPI